MQGVCIPAMATRVSFGIHQHIKTSLKAETNRVSHIDTMTYLLPTISPASSAGRPKRMAVCNVCEAVSTVGCPISYKALTFPFEGLVSFIFPRRGSYSTINLQTKYPHLIVGTEYCLSSFSHV